MAHFSETARQIVAVAITPQLGVEVAVLDKKSPIIQKYARSEFDYDIANRKVNDYDDLKSVVRGLFSELDIPTKSNIYLVVPNVHLAFENVQPMQNDIAIDNILLSKAEEQYFFKKSEPKSAWTDVRSNHSSENRLLIYTSIQEDAIDEFRRIFTELGSTLVGIESSYPAMIRGLAFSGVVEKEEELNSDWNLLLINTNSYAIINATGVEINDFVEVPVPIKQCSIEEAYQVISTSVAQHLPAFPAKKLVIVSQAENISATVLKDEIIYDYEKVAYNCNKYAEISDAAFPIASSVNEKAASAMSFSVLGALSVGHMEENAIQLNFLGDNIVGADVYFTFNFQGREIQVTQELAKKAFIALFIILVVLFALLWGVFYLTNEGVKKSTLRIEKEISGLESKISNITSKGEVVDIETLVGQIIDQNKQTINFYDSIATDIPQNVWLQYYYNKSGDKVAIEGVSTNIGDIYGYYKSLKVISPSSSIKLNKLQIMTQIDDEDYDIAAPDMGDKFYEFEIANVESPKVKAGKTPLDGLVDSEGNNQAGTKSRRTNRKSSLRGVVPPGLTPPSVDNLPQVDIR